MEFVNVDLPCNKLSLQLLANDFVTCIKKRQIIEMDKEKVEPPKPKAIWEKKKPIKQFGKKSTKASISISDLVGQLPPDIQALFINTNIVILVLYFFQISPKFWKKTRCLITVLRESRKKNVVPLVVSIFEE